MSISKIVPNSALTVIISFFLISDLAPKSSFNREFVRSAAILSLYLTSSALFMLMIRFLCNSEVSSFLSSALALIIKDINPRNLILKFWNSFHDLVMSRQIIRYLDFNKFGVESPTFSTKQLVAKNKNQEPKPYVIQIGAFGSIQNATRLKLQVSQIGYNVEIVPVQTNGKVLQAVRVIRYRSKSSAERIGSTIKKKLGIEFRVLYRPVNHN